MNILKAGANSGLLVIQSLINWLISIPILLVSVGCASNNYMYYQFAYDMQADGQNARILDYNLSREGKTLIAAMPSVKTGGGLNQEGIHKYSPRPTDLFIEWKDLTTGSDFSRNVNLRGLVDQNLEGATIYPIVDGEVLSLYLILEEIVSPENSSPIPGIARNHKTILIYSK
jgi:hypothetical protein